MSYEEFIKKLQGHIEAGLVTQAELARQIGCTKQHINKVVKRAVDNSTGKEIRAGRVLRGKIERFLWPGSADPVYNVKPTPSDNLMSHIKMEMDKRDKIEQALINDNKMASLAEELGKIGYFRREVSTSEGVWSHGFRKVFGIPENQPSDFNFLVNNVVEENSREAFVKAFNDAIADQDCFKYSHKYCAINLETKKKITCRVITKITRNEFGEAVSYFGITQDISNLIDDELKEKAKKLAKKITERRKKPRS